MGVKCIMVKYFMVALMCGLFCISSFNNVVEANKNDNAVVVYSVLNDVKDAVTDKAKQKGKEVLENATQQKSFGNPHGTHAQHWFQCHGNGGNG